MRLPMYAKPIAEMRARGERPADTLFVTVGRIDVHWVWPNNGAVTIDARSRIEDVDLQWAIGLDIEVVTKRADDRALAVCQALNAMHPRNLVLWETESGKRWWLRDELGPWPKAHLLHEADRSFVPPEPDEQPAKEA